MEAIGCVINSLNELLFNLDDCDICDIQSFIFDLRNELEEVGNKVLLVDSDNGLLIRDTVDELDNYTDCFNRKEIEEGIQLCIVSLESLDMV